MGDYYKKNNKHIIFYFTFNRNSLLIRYTRNYWFYIWII